MIDKCCIEGTCWCVASEINEEDRWQRNRKPHVYQKPWQLDSLNSVRDPNVLRKIQERKTFVLITVRNGPNEWHCILASSNQVRQISMRIAAIAQALIHGIIQCCHLKPFRSFISNDHHILNCLRMIWNSQNLSFLMATPNTPCPCTRYSAND